MKNTLKNGLLAISLLSASVLSMTLLSANVQANTPEDPWEEYNRAVFRFNDGMDSLLVKPIAQGYDTITPTPVQRGITNFFNNLFEVNNIANNLLQGKWNETASSTWRLLINSTAGWFGIFDVASELGLKRYEEDFGQTLGYWGVSSGPYVVLPFLGSSTLRDSVALPVDWAMYDLKDSYDMTFEEKWHARTLDLVHARASYLSAEGFIFGDRYSFLRDIYLQSRAGEVYDGTVPAGFGSDFESADAGEDSWDDGGWGDESGWDDEEEWVDDSGW